MVNSKQKFKKYLPLKPNPKKEIIINLGGIFWARYPVKTPLITEKINLFNLLKQKLGHLVQKGDILAISEKAVSIWQGRAWPKEKIKPSFWAKFLVRFVTKTKKGVGISSPETFELAIREAGLLRILIAAFLAGLTKPFGIKGVFYHIAGRQVAMIDGAADYVIPPYNRYVSLGPKDADGLADKISKTLRIPMVAIVDANDYGVEVPGLSQELRKSRKEMLKLIKELLQDNPAGQTNESTPFIIMRRLSRYKNELLTIVLLGDPGAGKGVQAQILKERYNFVHISPGDLFREEMAKKTTLGRMIEENYKIGKPQPNDLVNQLVYQKLKKIFQNQRPKGIVFDMFPFNRVQADALLGLQKEFHLSDPIIIWLDISEKEVIARLQKRWVCSKCKSIFKTDDLKENLKTKKCPKCSGDLIKRIDDSPELILRRIKWYRTVKQELKKYYSPYPFWLDIDGSPPIPQVAKEIEKKLEFLIKM